MLVRSLVVSLWTQLFQISERIKDELEFSELEEHYAYQRQTNWSEIMVLREK
jgi:hypothetical protein